MTRPTHAIIDGNNHLIVSIEDAGPNSAHTHRVKFACGMLFDVRGEHQFEEHAAEPGDHLREHFAGGDEEKAYAEKMCSVYDAAVSRRDKIAMEQQAHKDLAEKLKSEPDTDENVVKIHRALKAAEALEKDVQAAMRDVDAATGAWGRATEAYHKARKGRDRRWLTHAEDKPVKVDCAACLAAEKQ